MPLPVKKGACKKKRKKSSVSPTQKAIQVCKDNGWTYQVVERWNAFAKVRQDLFGFIDILVIRPGRIMGIQATSCSNHSARVKKINEEPKAVEWIRAGGEIHVWSFEGKEVRKERIFI